MIKHQNIFFDNSLSFDINNGGIIKDDTEILNLFFHDNTNSNSMCLIGNKLEWKPKIWTDFEREKIIKVKLYLFNPLLSNNHGLVAQHIVLVDGV